ncbi:MAG: lytic transglycosylase domain-containing protein [Firmicutes bacterium]|jgi:soluble lytic murein transglycosylase|nr:lytic transglycosylase domain-containing protein [Bacillota bacterium]
MVLGKKKIILQLLIWSIIAFIGFSSVAYISARLLFPLHYWPLLQHYGQHYNIDPLLLAAVIRAESKFFPRAQSEAGALGLMQIVPETGVWAADEMGLTDFNIDKLFDPAINIQVGAWYLRELLEEFNEDIVLALAAYNCGRGNVKQWLQTRKETEQQANINELPYAETRSYVQKVLRNYYWYQRIYG